MSDYNQYITAINKIFDYLAKMKAGWNSPDNKNYIATIEDYKDIVTSNVSKFKQPVMPQPQNEDNEDLEALGND